MVPLVSTPSEVYRGDWGFFFTPRMGSWKVVLSSAARGVSPYYYVTALSSLTVSDVGLGHTQSHRTDEALELDRLASEALADERGLVDHTLPALALVLSGLDDLEHLLLGDASNLGQGHGILGGAIFSSVLDGR